MLLPGILREDKYAFSLYSGVTKRDFISSSFKLLTIELKSLVLGSLNFKSSMTMILFADANWDNADILESLHLLV